MKNKEKRINDGRPSHQTLTPISLWLAYVVFISRLRIVVLLRISWPSKDLITNVLATFDLPAWLKAKTSVQANLLRVPTNAINSTITALKIYGAAVDCPELIKVMCLVGTHVAVSVVRTFARGRVS